MQLVDHARRGLRVLRLKGGDPCVFGRGGEEMLALAAAGVPFRVVPGVTAGLGGLAGAGIPATMRGVNQAIILATGHDPDEDGAMDWSALARTRQPIVLYMGLRNLDKIAAALMRGGLPADTPAAVIASATLADQRDTRVNARQNRRPRRTPPISRRRPWWSSATLCVPASNCWTRARKPHSWHAPAKPRAA